MVSPHHFPHWYPTAAYLYVLRLDALALACEYLRRHPDYRLDWLHRHRRPQAAQHAAHRWGLRLLEDPALDARDAHPAWLPGHAGVVQLYPDADPPQNATAFAFWRIPGHKQLIHDGKRLVLIARDRKSTRLNSSHSQISYAVFCLKKKKKKTRKASSCMDR